MLYYILYVLIELSYISDSVTMSRGVIRCPEFHKMQVNGPGMRLESQAISAKESCCLGAVGLTCH